MARTNEEEVHYHLSEAIRISRGILLTDHEQYNCMELRQQAANGLARHKDTAAVLSMEMRGMETHLLELNAFIQSMERAKSQMIHLGNSSSKYNPNSVAKKVPASAVDTTQEPAVESPELSPVVLSERIAGLDRRMQLVTALSVAAVLVACIAIVY